MLCQRFSVPHKRLVLATQDSTLFLLVAGRVRPTGHVPTPKVAGAALSTLKSIRVRDF